MLKNLKESLLSFYPFLDKKMMLALTYRCQCNCEHCGSHTYREKAKEELTKEEILNLISQHGKLGGREVYFFGGEPLLVKELPYYIRYAKKRGLDTRLDTNGYLLNEDMVQRLKTSGLDFIGVSIDSPYDYVHDELRKLKGLFYKAINGIKHCKEYQLNCYISTYATKESLRNGDLVKIINIADDIGIAGVRILSTICSGKWSNKKEVLLSEEDFTILRSLIKRGKVIWESSSDKEAPFVCSAFKKKLFYVSGHGDVCPCCYLPMSFGNIRKEPFKKIVMRMHRASIFNQQLKFNDCPANDESFINACHRLTESILTESSGGVEEWDEWASSYRREVDRLLGVNDEIISSKVDFNNKTVLDLGGGTGRFAKTIVKNVKHLTLLDFSSRMLEEAKKELPKFSNVDFKNVDIEDVNFSLDKKYDIIIAISLLHHFKDEEKAIEKLKSYLISGGKLIILEVLGGKSFRDDIVFHSKIIKKYGLPRALWQFCYNKLSSPRLKKHLLKEKRLKLEDFKKRYESLLPGSNIEVINGIFGLLVWNKSF
jgi:MoaA/NifB/PqqE/SkfB family radical SAM enzyme